MDRYHDYLIHRATKRIRASRLELRLLDMDLAEIGVHIPWAAVLSADAAMSDRVLKMVQDVLNAA